MYEQSQNIMNPNKEFLEKALGFFQAVLSNSEFYEKARICMSEISKLLKKDKV
jgi:hypothetical protein